VSHEAIRKWCGKFGQDYAKRLRRRRPRPGDKWHLDEVFITINGKRYYLWRAMDQDDHVLDILVQSRRNKKAAKKFFRKLLKGLMYVPRVVITDRLKRKRQLNNQPPSTSTVVPVTKSFLIRNKIPDATSSAVPGRGMT